MKRLSPAFLTMLMLGVVGVLVALYVAKNVFGRAAPVPQEEIINVPMALTDLEPGTKVTEGHIGLGRARRSKVSADIVRTSRVVVGRVVKTAIKAAEPISTFDLYPPGKGPGLQVEPGMSAVTIAVGDSTSLADGQIQPEQYVDIHFTPSSVPNSSETGGMTMTLFKGVKVLAINGSSTGTTTSRGNNSVTLELTEGQTNIILLAKDKGALNLVYTPAGRGSGIVAVDDEHRATLDKILGITKPEEEKVEPPFVTEVYNGSGRRVQLFKEGKRADRYAIENYDYNRRYAGANGGYNGGVDLGTGGQIPNSDFGNQTGGYYSLPGTVQGTTGQGNNNSSPPTTNQGGFGQNLDFGANNGG